MSLRNKALSGFLWNILDKIINQLGTLILSIYLARVIGPEGVGLIGLLLIFLLITQSLVDSGFSQALIQKSNAITESDASTVFYINLVLGIFLYSILFISAPFIAQFYEQPLLIDLSRFLFLIVLFNAVTIVSRSKLTIKVDFKSQMIANSWGTIISSIFAIIIAKSGYGYWALAWSLVIKALISNIVIWYYSRWLPKLIWSRESFNQLFNFGWKILVAGQISTIVNNAHSMFLGKFYNTGSVGLYNQANTIASGVSGVISSTLQTVTFPILTSIKEQTYKVTEIYIKLLKLTMFVSIPIFIGLASISKPLVILLLGESWLNIVPILQIFCLNRLMTPVAIVNINILNALGRSDLSLKLELYKVPFTLGTLLLGIPFGVIGVAWSAFFSTLIAFFINSHYQKKLFNFGSFKQINESKKFFLAGCLMYSTNLLIISENPFFEIFLKIVLGATIYITTLFFMKENTLFILKDILINKKINKSID